MKSAYVFKPTGLRLASVLVLLCALFLTPAALAGQVEYQDSPVTYLSYNVDITLRPDGNFSVREIQRIKFELLSILWTRG